MILCFKPYHDSTCSKYSNRINNASEMAWSRCGILMLVGGDILGSR